MKRRIVSLILILAMLTAVLTFGTTASAAESFDGTSYTVVTTSSELATALSKGGNILLKNDITLDSKFASAVSVKPGTRLNGNGYSLIYKSNRSVALFNFAAGTATGVASIYIQNISFGTKEFPMQISGSASLFAAAKENTCEVNVQNTNFYVKGTGMTGMCAAIFAKLNTHAYFSGCTLDANLTATTTSFLGGWVGEIYSGSLEMENCVTKGTFTAANGSAGAVVGQCNLGTSTYTNCVNLATVTAKEIASGLIGNIGTGASCAYVTACKNYGDITSTSTGYNSMAGAIYGRVTSHGDAANQRLRVVYDCINYGSIKAARAGGIAGSSHDWDTGAQGKQYVYYSFDGCINYGTVTGEDYAGGIMGIASPITYCADVIDCINVGKITSTAGYAGNLAGMLSSGVVTGGYAAGIVTSKKGGDPVLGLTTGNYTLMDGSYKNQSWKITTPIAEGVSYIGDAAEPMSGVTKVTEQTLADALKGMGDVCGHSFVMADDNNPEALVVAAEPIMRGIQQSLQSAEGKIDLRLVASLNALDAFTEIGFYMTLHANGNTIEQKHTTNVVYKSLNAVNVNGEISSMSAKALSGEYLSAITLTNIPNDMNVLVELTPYTVDASGNEYRGGTKTLTCRDGSYQLEPMVINGVRLEDYAIVYDAANKNNEQLLATRMADQIAQTLGVVLPVFSSAQTCTRDAKIVVGTAAAAGIAKTGRYITVLNNNTITVTGDNTAQISESVSYVLDVLADKTLMGDTSWKIADEIAVPVDDEILLMAYNMGAKDNADIKKAEWDLIVDYLPDILTSQEPWAGFLDDFLNDYAVQPATKFQQSTSDDDVMTSNVNNKAFEGNGYYGVYWGLPRWVPGDANNAGKASYSIILYAKDRFTPDTTKAGTFWLSETPDVSGSVISGAQFARCATYLTLTDNNTGKQFVVVNVHLDYISADVQTRQAKILVNELKKRVDTDLPIFVTGDMNAGANSAVLETYQTNTAMPMMPLDVLAEHAYRMHHNPGWAGSMTIDWLLTNHPEMLEVSYYNTCFEKTFLNKLWNSSLVLGMPSDHPAICAKFKIR